MAKEVAWDPGFRTEANALGPAAFEVIEVAPDLLANESRGLEPGCDELGGFDPVVAALKIGPQGPLQAGTTGRCLLRALAVGVAAAVFATGG